MFSKFQQATVPYAANSPQQTNIPAGGMLCEVECLLSFAPTVTGVNNSVANTLRGDETGVIQSIQIKGESALPIFDVPGSTLKWMALLMDNDGVPLEIPTGLADGATANPTLTTAFRLPFWATRAGKPYDTAYDNTAEANGLTLTVNWYDATKVNSTCAAGVGGFTTPPTLAVFTTETAANTHPFLRKRRYWGQFTFNATGPQRFQLEPGPAYRQFLINIRDGANVDQTGYFDIARLYIGGQQRQVTHEKILAQLTRQRIGINIANTTVTKNTIEKIGANYLWKLDTDGYLSYAADTLQRQGNYIEFNVLTAPATVTVVYEVLEDLRNPAFGGLKAVRAA